MHPTWKEVSHIVGVIFLFGILGYNLHNGTSIYNSLFRALVVYFIYGIIIHFITNTIINAMRRVEKNKMIKIREEAMMEIEAAEAAKNAKKAANKDTVK